MKLEFPRKHTRLTEETQTKRSILLKTSCR